MTKWELKAEIRYEDESGLLLTGSRYTPNQCLMTVLAQLDVAKIDLGTIKEINISIMKSQA